MSVLRRQDHVMIDKSVILDKELSRAAVGLYCTLALLPDDAVITQELIEEILPYHSDDVLDAWEELVMADYIEDGQDSKDCFAILLKLLDN